MPEFIYHCPHCGQEMKCDSEQFNGTVITTCKIKSSGSNISRTQVISDTRKALELAQQVSGVTATGFHADNVLIGTDKATCHFTCYVNGRKHIGGMEFRISGNRLIPTGQYYLDSD